MVTQITATGQATIPLDVRECAGLMPGTDVAFEIEDGVVRLVKAGEAGRSATSGQRRIEILRGQGDFKMTTHEVARMMPGPAATPGDIGDTVQGWC